MIDFIQRETKKMMFNCCERHAKSVGLSVENVQLILALNMDAGEGDEPNIYTVCENYAPKKTLTIKEVLNVKIDFLQYSVIAPPFITKSLVKFSGTKEIELEKVSVMCVPSTDEKGKPDIKLALYDGNKYIETITFDELFSEEDAEIPN